MGEYDDINPNRDSLNSVLYLVYLILVVSAGFFSLFYFGGLTEEIDKLKFLLFTGVMAMLGLGLVIIKLGKATFLSKYEWSKYIYAPIHDVELGYFKSLEFIRNPIRLLFWSIFIFSFLAFIGSAFPQSSAYIFPLSAGQVSQQTTPAGKLLYSFYNAPAENLFLYVLLFIGISFLQYFFRRFKVPFKVFLVIALIVAGIVGAFAWSAIHVGVSGSDQEKLLGNAIFGFNGAIITIATGSIIPFEVYHITNNLFIRIRELFGNQFTIYIFGGIFIFIFISYALYSYSKAQKRGRAVAS